MKINYTKWAIRSRRFNQTQRRALEMNKTYILPTEPRLTTYPSWTQLSKAPHCTGLTTAIRCSTYWSSGRSLTLLQTKPGLTTYLSMLKATVKGATLYSRAILDSMKQGAAVTNLLPTKTMPYDLSELEAIVKGSTLHRVQPYDARLIWSWCGQLLRAHRHTGSFFSFPPSIIIMIIVIIIIISSKHTSSAPPIHQQLDNNLDPRKMCTDKNYSTVQKTRFADEQFFFFFSLFFSALSSQANYQHRTPRTSSKKTTKNRDEFYMRSGLQLRSELRCQNQVARSFFLGEGGREFGRLFARALVFVSCDVHTYITYW